MITTDTGRILYNTQKKSLEDFFKECVHILFDDGVNNNLIYCINSPFSNAAFKNRSLADHIADYESKDFEVLDDAIAPGFPASDAKALKATSFGVSNILMRNGKEDSMLAFIGYSLEVGMAGGQNLYFSEPEVLTIVFEGWKIYRQLLNNESTNLQPNKLASWNGQWLNYRLSNHFKGQTDFQTLDREGFFKPDKKGVMVEPIYWSELYFTLNKYFGKELNKVTPSMGAIGQMKSTMGFLVLDFKYCRSLSKMYEHLTGKKLDSKEFRALFGLSSMRIVDTMRVSMRTLQPPSLEKMLEMQKAYKYDEKNYFQLKTYLLVMLGTQLEKAQKLIEETAKMLVEYRNSTNKTDRKNKVEKGLFGNNTKANYIDTLCEIIPDLEGDYKNLITEIQSVLLKLNKSDFKMFALLVKLEYAKLEKFN
ncbi:hypothetical protein [Flammeovirga agarivorans]|uniref:Uncharacterized protein n=1 Tax=Flammeovirga agarivorans TaxID=2726742 RepID=A0A7X8SPL8_9BACT|nr:hypothetical protein [Flammeovirga agarivorans]NLR94044.1 hypothetical protein [Flammeovirga agarivorans]